MYQPTGLVIFLGWLIPTIIVLGAVLWDRVDDPDGDIFLLMLSAVLGVIPFINIVIILMFLLWISIETLAACIRKRNRKKGK